MSRPAHRKSVPPLGWARRAARAAPALTLALGLAAVEAAAARDSLYRWTDADGVVRYTADPDRIPRHLRGSAVPIELGNPRAGPPAPEAAPEALPAATETRGTGGEATEPPIAPDPFNAPDRAARVEAERAGTPRPAKARSAEIDPRIRELEEAIARDEEALKALISRASADGSDPMLDSPELREIARRLPALQADLRALRERREGR